MGDDLTPRRRVLVTGAAGRIGSGFARSAADRFDLRLLDRDAAALRGLTAFGRTYCGDLADRKTLAHASREVDTIVHLGAAANPAASWDQLLHSNIEGAHTVFSVAAEQGCRRVVFASSVHTVAGYGLDAKVRPTDPVNPTGLYGATKCFAEALGRYTAEQRGVSVVVLRIGAFAPTPEALPHDHLRDVFIGADQLHRRLVWAVEVEGLRFALVHAVGNRESRRIDSSFDYTIKTSGDDVAFDYLVGEAHGHARAD